MFIFFVTWSTIDIRMKLQILVAFLAFAGKQHVHVWYDDRIFNYVRRNSLVLLDACSWISLNADFSGFHVLNEAKSNTEIASGDASILYTKDNYTYENFQLEILESNSVIFQVKACSDAHVALIEHNVSTCTHIGVI